MDDDGGIGTSSIDVTVTPSSAVAQIVSFSVPDSVSVGTAAILSATGGGSANPVVFSVDASSGTGVCSVSGANGANVSYKAIGTCVLNANQAGAVDFTAAAQVQRTVLVKKTSTITFAPIANRTMLKATFTVKAKASSKLPVTFTSGTPSVCTATGANGSAITLLMAGTCSITASQAFNALFAPSADVTQSFTVSMVDQTITFEAVQDHTMKKASFNVKAKASSKLPVRIASSTPAVCTIGGATGRAVTLLTPGSCILTATQPGSVAYNSATLVTNSFTVSLAPQTITFATVADHTMKKPSFAARAKASSKLPVVLTSITPTVCTVGGSSELDITLLGPGTCTLQADQGGNNVFGPATRVSQSFNVTTAPGVATVNASI